MKPSQKILAALGAAAMAVAISVPVLAAEGLKEIHSLTEEERRAGIPGFSAAGRTLIPRTAAGKTGNPCAQFMADASRVSFTITSAAAADTYKVQLYQGTIAGGGTPASDYTTAPAGEGVSVSDLTVGESYYFVVSSLDAPAKGSNATYERITF